MKNCTLAYTLPVDTVRQSQDAFDRFSWNSFLGVNATEVGTPVGAGDAAPQWSTWSSSTDVIECLRNPSECPAGRFYPEACKQVAGHSELRVLGQHAKVDDSFLEATRKGLSNSPVIDSEGKFLRYEILVSPRTEKFVADNTLYQPETLCAIGSTTATLAEVIFPCGETTYGGGDPANDDMGSIVVKLAWMELGSRDASQFHTQELIVFTPGYRRTDGTDSCEKRTMALVGMHLVRKTPTQSSWTWATFEHANNAPDCEGLPPAGRMNPNDDPGPNTACPGMVDTDHNFFPADCSGGRCAACNTTPLTNAAPNTCLNPDVTDETGWCADEPPAATAGISRLCRQVPVEANYPDAAGWNEACRSALSDVGSVWANYDLISTQWSTSTSTICENISSDAVSSIIEPKVNLENAPRAYLANTSMESYERSNCMGCHRSAMVETSSACGPAGASTDFAYWLMLEATR